MRSDGRTRQPFAVCTECGAVSMVSREMAKTTALVKDEFMARCVLVYDADRGVGVCTGDVRFAGWISIEAEAA